jgi:hypothetical protein
MKKNITGNQNILLVGIFAALAVGSAACNDMTTAQYQAQQCQANANQLKAFNGLYTGSLTSLDGKTSMVAVQVNVDTQVVPATSSDGTGTTCTAKSVGSVSIKGATTLTAPFQTLSISPTDGSVSGVLTVPNPNDSINAKQMQVEGTISGGKFTNGKISSVQNPSNGGLFSAQKNGPMPSTQNLSQGPRAETQAPSFSGTLSSGECNGVANDEIVNTPCVVTMGIADVSNSSADNFFDFFDTVDGDVAVTVTIKGTIDAQSLADGYKPSSYPQSFTGTLDQDGKSLTASGTAVTGGATLSLKCNGVPVSGNPNGNFGWDCTRDGGQSPTVHFVVYPSSASVIK